MLKLMVKVLWYVQLILTWFRKKCVCENIEGKQEFNMLMTGEFRRSIYIFIALFQYFYGFGIFQNKEKSILFN